MKVLPEIIVTPADAEIEESPCRAAVIVTVGGLGTFAGAVYVAASGVEEAIVPVAESPPGVPFTSQMIAALEFCTVAENCRVLPVTTFPVLGEMLTLAAGATMVTLVLPDTDKSVWRIAVMVT